MDIALFILSGLGIILGYIGAFVPGLSGPPIAWLGVLSLYLVPGTDIPAWMLVATAVLALLSLILEWTIPAYGTKVFKGSTYGVRGSYVGMFVGMVLPIPFSMLLGPFLGALIGELMHDPEDRQRAIQAAFGTFLGFLFAILLNFLMVSLMALVWGYYAFIWLTL
ncbi:MAG: DUF456 domain-containing protein [Bacteroidetes bacterium]|nr:DUF456 domain-containing protein [Bacteroidota bacterium]